MVKNTFGTHERRAEVLRLGKEGRTTLKEAADAWSCSTQNISDYLHRLQEQDGYAYLVDGKGVFRIFQEVE